MKELQAKAKVTQTMTRDGLVVENQADGTVENVSSREAEQDYSTDAEGKAEKILERAEDAKEKHSAKKKAKKAAETAATAESEDGLHRSAARLELTEEERADPALQPFIQKAEAKADKLDSARAALPKKRVPVKGKVYDAVSGKAKSTLRFEQQDKGPPSLKPNPTSRPLSEALLFAHGKIHEVEHENVGVEGGHKGEELVERQTAKAIRGGIRHRKLKPYKAVEKAERQLMSANAEYFYQKSLRDNPQIAQAASNPISRMWQKRRIKQQYLHSFYPLLLSVMIFIFQLRMLHIENIFLPLNFSTQLFFSGQVSQILRHEQMVVVMQDGIARNVLAGFATQQNADRGVVALFAFKFIVHSNIHINLADILMGDCAHL